MSQAFQNGKTSKSRTSERKRFSTSQHIPGCPTDNIPELDCNEMTAFLGAMIYRKSKAQLVKQTIISILLLD